MDVKNINNSQGDRHADHVNDVLLSYDGCQM